MTTLAERLGYAPETRLVIISCDDLGSCHAANVGVYQALRDGLATSASLMVPAPWAREAASRYRGEDIGVHLTLNAEHDLYRWGPITHAPSLLDGDGGFPRTLDDIWDHADLDEARRECRAQVERSIMWGFDVSHLASHLGALQLRPEFFDIYLDLAVDFRLPIRLPSADTEEGAGFPFRRLATEEGVLFPDHFEPARNAGSRGRAERVVSAPAARRHRAARAARRSTRPSCGRCRPTGRPGSTTSTWWPGAPRSTTPWSAPARCASGSGPCARRSAPAEAPASGPRVRQPAATSRSVRRPTSAHAAAKAGSAVRCRSASTLPLWPAALSLPRM